MRCVQCDVEMQYEIVEFEMVLEGERVAVRQPGWYCWTCNTGRHSADDLWAADEALMQGKPDPGVA